MLSVDEALDHILADVPRVRAESVRLSETHGRFLYEDLHSPIDVPSWDNSAMDGYALRAADTREGEVWLRINEVIPAGRMGSQRVEPGTASAIMTGAPMPEGADAVVMVEHTNGAREGKVQIRGAASPRQNVRPQGDALRRGQRIAAAGSCLSPALVGMIASVGIPTVKVARRPIVAILSTGDEVVAPGASLRPGQIYSSNSVALAGMVRAAGGVPLDLGNVPDELEATVERLRIAIDAADVVLTTGGVSVGEYDFVKPAYERLGAGIDFWKVWMKPGKPLAFGHASAGGRSVPLFGLPGNPVSCLVNFLQFVRPYLRTQLGALQVFLPVLQARLTRPLRDRSQRLKLIRVVLSRGPQGELLAESTGTQSSGVLTSMARAHGLAMLGPEQAELQPGDRIPVQILDPDFVAAGERPPYPT